MSASREQEFRLGAERGDTPLLPGERVWGFWGFAYANSALAVATWVFLIGGATALFVTHDQLEAFAIGDQIGVMHDGRLHQWDDAYSLYHRPATRFVADFIGHGVFVPARIVHRGGGAQVETPLGVLGNLTDCPLPDAYPDGHCDLLLRADDIVHDDNAPTKAQIVRKAFRGSEFLYTLKLTSGETVMAHVPSHHNHRVGEWIGIRPEVDHVVTFAAQAA